jgi:hypothetical protein
MNGVGGSTVPKTFGGREPRGSTPGQSRAPRKFSHHEERYEAQANRQ